MDIIIQSLGFTAGENLEAFITEKLNALSDDKVVRANVTLYIGPDNSGENKFCEIRLEAPGNDPFVKKCTEHFETSVSECVDVLIAMANKQKEKTIHRRQADAAEIHDQIIAAEAEFSGDVDLEDVVK
ncbi:MAG: HPF/RaiA family ribosome-associated protein [Ferruginibacter sp.]